MNPSLFSRRSLRRGVLLGLGLFVLFMAAGALLWWFTASILGMDRVPAFFLVACATPFLVGIPVTLVVLALPLERRQALLGTGPETGRQQKPGSR